MDTGIEIAELVTPTIPLGRKGRIAVKVEELKAHIHRELFGDRFPTMLHIREWKEQQKQAIMLRSVKIMLHHEQSEREIAQMLEVKFFLTEAQAQEFLQEAISTIEKEKGDDSSCQS